MRQASAAALPKDLGVEAALNSDAESAYLAQWAQSHAAPTDAVTVEADTHSILPPASEAPKPSKPRTPKAAAKTADKPRAKPKSEVKPAAVKPRAKKAKPEAEA